MKHTRIRAAAGSSLDENALLTIEVADMHAYRFRSEKALMAKRRFIYGVNSNNAAGRRWRTMRENLTLIILRIS